jgi:putative transposase
LFSRRALNDATEARFIETSTKEDELNEEGKRRLNVNGVLKIIGVSRSGYLSYKKRLPSDRDKRKEAIKENIK